MSAIHEEQARAKRQQEILSDARLKFRELQTARRSGNREAVERALENFCRSYEGAEETVDSVLEKRRGDG